MNEIDYQLKCENPCKYLLKWQKYGIIFKLVLLCLRGNMSYLTLYRKWRPKTFDEVKGREEIVTILKNQIKNNRISHAYLFCGTRGTGKTSVAKIFARAVNCENPIDASPCYKCDTCKALDGNNLDIIEIDAASNNGVDNIRDIRTEAEYLPNIGKYKVYIIDEVHMLSSGAFNALLKILEEPPEYIIFILATTEINKIPVTIISRCQRFDFLPIDKYVIFDHLKYVINKEKIDISDEALLYISDMADGGFRDALSILEQIAAYGIDSKLELNDIMKILGRDTFIKYSKLLEYISIKNLIKMNELVDKIISEGKTYEVFINEFANYVKNLNLMKITGDVFDNLSKDEFDCIVNDCDRFSTEYLAFVFDKLLTLNENLKKFENKRMYIDLMLIKIAIPREDSDTSDLLIRIQNLEHRIDNISIDTNQVTIEKSEEKDDLYQEYLLPENKEELKKLSTDIKQVIKNWNTINWENKNTAGKIRQWLSKASIAIRNDRLSIVTSSDMAYERLKRNIENIKKTIEEEIEVAIEIDISMANVNINKIDLSKMIDFEIEKE